MRDLRIANDNDWEELSIYLATDYYKKNYRVRRIDFEFYGRNGQAQHGIDIFSRYCNFVVQCKHVKKLTWDNILGELIKSDRYPNPIDHYLITTTAPRDRDIQDRLKRGYFHQRPNGHKFEIDILYWDEIRSLECVPNDIISRIFPSLNLEDTNSNSYLFKLFKTTISNFITRDNLFWLENYDFSIGYIPCNDFEPFENLYYEIDRAKSGISLIKGHRDNLSKIHEIGTEFFDELERFVKEVKSQIIGKKIDGIEVLWLDPSFFPENRFKNIIFNWKQCANNLARCYREMVLGENP